MKKLWLALVLVAVLGLSCWAGAEECKHLPRVVVGPLNDTHHISICFYCGEEVEAEHYEYCDVPGECRGCGETGVVFGESKHYEKYKDLGDYHQLFCSSCNAVLADVEKHNVWCTDSTFCSRCGLRNLSVQSDVIQHSSKAGVWFDLGNGTHQKKCSDCDTVFEEVEEHWSKCTSPGICAGCGITLDSSYEGSHHIAAKNMGTYHIVYCIYCEETMSEEPHFSMCTGDAARCTLCWEYIDFVIEVIHPVSAEPPYVEITSEYHAFNCPLCGDIAKASHDTAGNGGSCSDCGYAPSTSLPGDADGNSSVTLADVRAILSGNVSSEANADVTGDGNVNEKDVLRIMQYISGWDVTLQ